MNAMGCDVYHEGKMLVTLVNPLVLQRADFGRRARCFLISPKNCRAGTGVNPDQLIGLHAVVQQAPHTPSGAGGFGQTSPKATVTLASGGCNQMT